MLSRVINHRFRPVLTLAVAAFSLLAVALPLSPAKAQCFGVDLGFACGGLGVGSWLHSSVSLRLCVLLSQLLLLLSYYYNYPYYYGGSAYTYTPYGRPEYENQ